MAGTSSIKYPRVPNVGEFLELSNDDRSGMFRVTHVVFHEHDIPTVIVTESKPFAETFAKIGT